MAPPECSSRRGPRRLATCSWLPTARARPSASTSDPAPCASRGTLRGEAKYPWMSCRTARKQRSRRRTPTSGIACTLSIGRRVVSMPCCTASATGSSTGSSTRTARSPSPGLGRPWPWRQCTSWSSSRAQRGAAGARASGASLRPRRSHSSMTSTICRTRCRPLPTARWQSLATQRTRSPRTWRRAPTWRCTMPLHWPQRPLGRQTCRRCCRPTPRLAPRSAPAACFSLGIWGEYEVVCILGARARLRTG
mmetsp:Transcript_91151/g.237644  ORF Transcript_91151/g.237644 Transcript_91151/m.237644 type:complete len:250 (+) Transcript_91151:251-1000(+)